MLAAECAWIVLRAEHARFRELLGFIDATLDAGDWNRPGTRALLLGLIERFQEFDEATHRPKGVVLLDILRGRSAEADELLDALTQEAEHCERLLSQSKALLRRGESSGNGSDQSVDSLLKEHRRLMLIHLDREDTLLHSQTARLLNREEWATVVSAMSAAMGTAKERDARP